jgi:hypothetical protein
MQGQVVAMEIQIWQMVVSTERELLERRLEQKARLGRSSVAGAIRDTRRSVRGWRLNPFSARVQTREAS